MAGSYLYDGALSPRTMDSIRDMMRSYPNPVELTTLPPHSVFELLPEHNSTGEDCMGQEYDKKTRMYGIVRKNIRDQAAGVFVFLYSVEEKKTFLGACPELVVNADPFRSIV